MLWSLLETDIITGNEIPVVSIGESLIYALVGFAITFFGKIIRGVTGKLEEKKKAVPIAVSPETAGEEGISEEVRVAIIAAISAYYMSENSNCEFKVKRIKRL